VGDLDVLGPADPDDAATVPGLPPVPPVPPGGPGGPVRPGVHRQDPRSSRPWPWLGGLVAVAVLATVGLAWLAGGLVGKRQPGGAPAAVDTVSPSASPLPAEPSPPVTIGPTMTVAAPSPSPTPAASPLPSVSTVVGPSPTPAPPQVVRVPNVVGERQGPATATLRAAGFTVSIVTAPAPSPRQARRVLAQRPGPGQVAGRGSTVTLVVASRG